MVGVWRTSARLRTPTRRINARGLLAVNRHRQRKRVGHRVAPAQRRLSASNGGAATCGRTRERIAGTDAPSAVAATVSPRPKFTSGVCGGYPSRMQSSQRGRPAVPAFLCQGLM
jgi:hypothetical protein